MVSRVVSDGLKKLSSQTQPNSTLKIKLKHNPTQPTKSNLKCQNWFNSILPSWIYTLSQHLPPYPMPIHSPPPPSSILQLANNYYNLQHNINKLFIFLVYLSFRSLGYKI